MKILSLKNLCLYTFLVITSQTLKIAFAFFKKGVQIQIPRQKVYFYWNFQVHTPSRKVTLIIAYARSKPS